MESGIVRAVGVWFYCVNTNRYLYLLRNDSKYPDTWGLVGGKVEYGETLIAAMERECAEELGVVPEYQQLIPIEKFTSPDSAFEYHTFWCRVDSEFTPNLNHEHIGYAWIETGRWPRPLHPGLWNTVNLDTIQKKITSLERTCIR
jgi:8-oxo-dGTP pyrophosphatase MutT (NUDIX family)